MGDDRSEPSAPGAVPGPASSVHGLTGGPQTTRQLTVLLTDIEGSVPHWERDADAMQRALVRHDELVYACVTRYNGTVVGQQGEGDSRFVIFDRARDAVAAICDLQLAFRREAWPTGLPFRVRAALHTGDATEQGGHYYGSTVNRCARLRGLAHGAQVLLSEATAVLVRGGLPAGAALRDLAEHPLRGFEQPERVYQLVHPELESEFPPLVGERRPEHNLPAPTTPLVGREHEVAHVSDLLRRDDVRLVTLTGAGGVGKTRVGLQVAADLVSDFADGVCFVPLAPVSDPELVMSAIAQALELREPGSLPLRETVREHLKRRHLLLVLDNFEQVLPAAYLIADLLAACARLKLLVTSRAALHLRGEHEVSVHPLPCPDPRRSSTETLMDCSAVTLFVQRAVGVKEDFRLSAADAPVVVEICRRVDGLPLGIELAAARVRLLPPLAMLSRLERRLPLLTGGARDLPARQRTLRDTIAWSYGLLNEEERRTYRLLGAFVGGCTMEAVEAISGDDGELLVLDHLESLVDKHLLQQVTVRGEPRFTMLGTIREHALDQLEAAGEAAAIRQRHADFYVQLAETADPCLIGHDQVTWLDRLEEEHGNLVAALTWTREARERDGRTAQGVPAALVGLRLAGALHWFWWLGGRVGEGHRWVTEVLAWDVGEEGHRARARALYAAGTLSLIRGVYAQAHRLLEDCITLAEDLHDPITTGRCLAYRCVVETYLSERGEQSVFHAITTATRAANLLDTTDDAWGQALAASQIGALMRRAGQFQQAEEVLRRSVDIARTTGDRYLLGSCLPKLGNLYLALGDFERAEPIYCDALAAFREIREQWWTARCLQFLAQAVIGLGDHARAALLLGGSNALLESGGARRIPGEVRAYEAAIQEVSQTLGAEGFQQVFERGQIMPLDTLLGLVLNLSAGGVTA